MSIFGYKEDIIVSVMFNNLRIMVSLSLFCNMPQKGGQWAIKTVHHFCCPELSVATNSSQGSA